MNQIDLTKMIGRVIAAFLLSQTISPAFAEKAAPLATVTTLEEERNALKDEDTGPFLMHIMDISLARPAFSNAGGVKSTGDSDSQSITDFLVRVRRLGTSMLLVRTPVGELRADMRLAEVDENLQIITIPVSVVESGKKSSPVEGKIQIQYARKEVKAKAGSQATQGPMVMSSLEVEFHKTQSNILDLYLSGNFIEAGKRIYTDSRGIRRYIPLADYGYGGYGYNTTDQGSRRTFGLEPAPHNDYPVVPQK